MSDVRKEIQEEVRYWMGLNLTPDQVEEIVTDPTLSLEIKECGLDTVTREMIGGFLARKICGLDWPINGDPEELKAAFWKAYRLNAPLLGYKLVDQGEPE